jgi:hypothetical protein
MKRSKGDVSYFATREVRLNVAVGALVAVTGLVMLSSDGFGGGNVGIGLLFVVMGLLRRNMPLFVLAADHVVVRPAVLRAPRHLLYREILGVSRPKPKRLRLELAEGKPLEVHLGGLEEGDRDAVLAGLEASIRGVRRGR